MYYIYEVAVIDPNDNFLEYYMYITKELLDVGLIPVYENYEVKYTVDRRAKGFARTKLDARRLLFKLALSTDNVDVEDAAVQVYVRNKFVMI